MSPITNDRGKLITEELRVVVIMKVLEVGIALAHPKPSWKQTIHHFSKL